MTQYKIPAQYRKAPLIYNHNNGHDNVTIAKFYVFIRIYCGHESTETFFSLAIDAMLRAYE